MRIVFYYLMYVSYANEPFTQSKLKELLNTCRINNKKRDVTGMLLYIDGKFLQVLEGRKEDVNFIFENIVKDPRHKKVNVIIEGRLSKRNFEAWHMSFKSFTARQFRKISGFKNLESFFQNNRITNESHVSLVFLKLFYNKNYKPISLT